MHGVRHSVSLVTGVQIMGGVWGVNIPQYFDPTPPNILKTVHPQYMKSESYAKL